MTTESQTRHENPELPQGLSFLTLGTGDAFSATRYGACLSVEHREGDTVHRVLVDCPHPIRKILHEGRDTRDLDVGSFDALVLPVGRVVVLPDDCLVTWAGARWLARRSRRPARQSARGSPRAS